MRSLRPHTRPPHGAACAAPGSHMRPVSPMFHPVGPQRARSGQRGTTHRSRRGIDGAPTVDEAATALRDRLGIPGVRPSYVRNVESRRRVHIPSRGG
jgi:hypothetical protein